MSVKGPGVTLDARPRERVDLEGQLSNPAKPLKTLIPQGSRAKPGARKARRTRQKQGAAPRQPASRDELGHYSNPATEPAGAHRSRPADVAPPSSTAEASNDALSRSSGTTRHLPPPLAA